MPRNVATAQSQKILSRSYRTMTYCRRRGQAHLRVTANPTDTVCQQESLFVNNAMLGGFFHTNLHLCGLEQDAIRQAMDATFNTLVTHAIVTISNVPQRDDSNVALYLYSLDNERLQKHHLDARVLVCMD